MAFFGGASPMNHCLSVNQLRNPRLNEYFAVVGLGDDVTPVRDGSPVRPENWEGPGDGPPHSEAVDGTKYRAKVISRFPLYDHEDNPFPSNLALFCLPGGYRLRRRMELPTFFAFVHTRANGQHMFGFVLTFFEPLTDGQMEQLKQMEQLGQEQRGEEQQKQEQEQEQEQEQQVQGSGRSGPALPPLFGPKCLCLLSCWPYFTGYREWLTSLYRISLCPTKMPLERYVCNFMLEVPLPIAGQVEVQYSMADGGTRGKQGGGGGGANGSGESNGSNGKHEKRGSGGGQVAAGGLAQSICFNCPPPNKPIAWDSLPFEPLFKCLDARNILTVFECLLLERSVVLLSSQMHLLTVCAEVLTILMYPLSWVHVYIPVLPEVLLGVLNAPMPFLVGIHSDFVHDGGVEIPLDVVRVHLDRNEVELCESHPLPSLPNRRRLKLMTSLMEFGERGPETRGEIFTDEFLVQADLAFPMALRPCDFDDAPDGEAEGAGPFSPNWDEVREAFTRFFVALLKGYRRFLVYPTHANPAPKSIFNKDGFVEHLDPEFRPFVAALTRTQSFQNFVDARIQPDPDDLDITFFDENIEAKRNRSKLHMGRKKDTQFLRSHAYESVRTVVALTPDPGGLEAHHVPVDATRFPSLREEMYAPPRILPAANEQKRGNSKLYENKKGRENKASASRMFRMMHGEQEVLELAASPAATIFSLFLMAFASSVGREPAAVKTPGTAVEGITTVRAVKAVRAASALTGEAESVPRIRRALSEATVQGAGLHLACNVKINTLIYGKRSSALSTILDKSFTSNELLEGVSGVILATGERSYERPLAGREGEASGDVSVVLFWDRKEERRFAIDSALGVAFETVSLMKKNDMVVEEAVYRTLMSACGRSGSSQSAMKVMDMLLEAGIMPDAMISRCLVDAFAMDEGGVANPFDLLDWSKYRAKGDQALKIPTFRADNNPFSSGGSNALSRFMNTHLNKDEGEDKMSQGTPASSSSRVGEDAEQGMGADALPIPQELQMQVALGERMLLAVFPELKVETEGETCPLCHTKLSSADVRKGWEADVNIYTTMCPAVVGKDDKKPCGRKFVARFSVHSSAPDWEGSTGIGTVLWCEYLPPWVLRKELQTLLVSYGIETVCSADFRLSKGCSGTNSTLFWNLVVHFRQYQLPLTFLLSGPFSAQVITPALLGT